MPLEVKLSAKFSEQYDGYPDKDLDLIDAFWDHCERHGLEGWKGKVKPSWIVPVDYPDREKRVKFTRENDLWHAHVGYPCWKDSQNPDADYKVSDWVVHFQYRRGDGFIKLVDYGFHNPFHLPTEDHLP